MVYFYFFIFFVFNAGRVRHVTITSMNITLNDNQVNDRWMATAL